MTDSRRGHTQNANGKPGNNKRRKRRLQRLWKITGSSLVTFVLVGLLLFTIFFTHLEWQWVAFLSGILAASVLSLVTASLKSEWALARRTVRASHLQERLAVESSEHAKTRERLMREMTAHRSDLERFSREIQTSRKSARHGAQAVAMLEALSARLNDAAFLLDREGVFRFHTRQFSLWCGVHPARIDGNVMHEALPQRLATVFREPLAQALAGKTGQVQLADDQGAGPMFATFTPHLGKDGQVDGVVVVMGRPPQSATERLSPSGAESRTESDHADAVSNHPAPATGDAALHESIAREVTGWRDPAARIREAIRRDEFLLYAQKIAPLRPSATAGLVQEIYIRMRDEEMKLIPPGAFLPVAEHSGMMPEIDRLVVRKVTAALAHPDCGTQLVCVNLSRQTLEDVLFPEFVARTLERGNLQADRLCFEFEDSDAIELRDDSARQASALKDIGCRISLSSFGSRDLNFQLLETLPLDLVKIDGRLILQIRRDNLALASVKAVVKACADAGVRTVAELVESEEVIAALRELGVDYAQGFGIAAPAPFLAPVAPLRRARATQAELDRPDSRNQAG